MTLILRLLSIAVLLGMAAMALCQYTSSQWPTTIGVVQRASSGSRDLVLFGTKARFTYTYEVAGTTYFSQRVGFVSQSTSVPVVGSNVPRQLREGDQVNVHYLPFLPSFSLLVPGISPSLLWWGIVAGLISITLWILSHLAREPMF